MKIAVISTSVVGALFIGFFMGKGFEDPADNDRPRYGNLGLPTNCRAYIDASIAGYRRKNFSADEAFNGLERNCGAGGQLWRKR